jgi:ABC-type glycerol-3-phosphate transport system substrate-binding protein
MELAEYLADAGFLAEWSQAAGYLPVRPSSLDQWNNFNERDLAEQFALAAQLRPANDLTFSLGPVLQEAVRQVLTRQSDSLQAAEAAAERLAKPYLP